ncbi:MAG: YwiC-like family protein [Armatimonadota bacterium]|nr:YwiC-like family protein [Armatimonadota bacterium]
MTRQSTGAGQASLRAVALPSEHGGWGFTLEPVLLGLLVAPGWAALGLGIAAVAAFLARHPLRLWLTDRRRGARYPRTGLAARIGLGFAAVSAAGLALAVGSASAPFWWPLALGALLALLQLRYDARLRGRHIVPEVSGAVAMASVAAAIALAGGRPVSVAAGLWLVLAMRAVAALFYARTQVMRARGVAASPAGAYVAEGAALVVLVASAAWGLSPWLSALGLGLLGLYSTYTFARPPLPARLVGWGQMVFGLLMVLLTAVGVRVGL